MSWSIGEVKALTIKAAKGAGFSWGLAEEVGASIEWLQANNAPGVRGLSDYLIWRETNQNQLTDINQFFTDPNNSQAVYCPILLGCAMLDFGFDYIAHVNAGIARVRQPILLLPFIGQSSSQAVQVTWEDCKVHLDATTLQHADQQNKLLAEQAICHFSSGQPPQTTSLLTRVPDSDQTYIQTLKDYAGKTYAPATEASRLAGAGAGLTDND